MSRFFLAILSVNRKDVLNAQKTSDRGAILPLLPISTHAAALHAQTRVSRSNKAA